MILVVDDSRAMRMIVMRELRKAGFETRDIEEAENGRVALDRIRTGGIHLVLSDWNMPEMTGITLLQALRREGNDVPFGFVTSESTPLMHRDALDAGADFVVTKPFNADSLSLQVERVMQGVRQGDGLGAALAQQETSLDDVLEGLLGQAVSVCKAGLPDPAAAGAVARYRSDSDVKRIMLVAEMGIAVSFGAALSKVPPATAEEALEDGELPENLERNLYEVFNVLSKVVPDREELWHFTGMKIMTKLVDHDEVRHASPLSWSRSVEVKIGRYPAGRLAFLRV